MRCLTRLVVLLGVLGSSGEALAQACTLGPYVSATSLATIDAAIDAAVAGEVVCLERGSTWSTASTPITLDSVSGWVVGNNVTVCAATSTACTDSGLANPKITITGVDNAIDIFGSSDGYSFTNIDVENSVVTGTGADGLGVFGYMPTGLQHFSWTGGTITGYVRVVDFPTSGSPLPDEIRIGNCTRPTTITGAETTSGAAAVWGMCTNCGFSLIVNNWGGTPNANGQGHMFDISATATPHASNVTIECSEFTHSHASSKSTGSFVKLAVGTDYIIRDNVFEQAEQELGVGLGVGRTGLDFDPHSASEYPYGVVGAEIYRNVFLMRNGAAFTNHIASDVNFYNNLIVLDWSSGGDIYIGAAITLTTAADGTGDDLEPDRTYIYNNTIFAAQIGNSQPILTFGNGIGHRLYNNVIQYMDTDADVVNLTCSHFGTNGVDIHDNYVYTPGDATPTVDWSGCTAIANNPTTYTTSPGLADPTNTALSAVDRLLITAADTLLWKLGCDVSENPACTHLDQDYSLNTRPTPVSIGALDVDTVVATGSGALLRGVITKGILAR